MAGIGTKSRDDDASDDPLTPAQRRLVESILTTSTLAAAAKEARVAIRTAHRWVRLPVVKSALRDSENEALAASSRRLAQLGATAIDQLESLLADQKIAPSLRLRAIDLVLTRGIRLRETYELAERLGEIEARFDELEPETTKTGRRW